MSKITREEILLAYNCGRRDFSNLDLSYIDLSGADLTNALLGGAILINAN